MNWNNITLQQFQDIRKLSGETDLDEVEKVERVISILYGKSEAEVGDMSTTEFNRLGRECAEFLKNDVVPGKPVRSFRVGARRYAINYKPTTLKHRQYVEISTFASDPIVNMHLIMASIVQPIRYGFKCKNKASEHAKIAEDMLNAPLIAVYHSCVFFCKLYRDLIKHIQDFLIKELMSKGITESEARRTMASLILSMDGFIAQSK